MAAPLRLRLCAGRLRWQAPPRRCDGDGAPRTAVLASGESGWATRTARSGGACWFRSKTTGRPAQTGPNGLTDTPGAPPAGPSHRARAQDHPPRAPGPGRALSRPSSLVCAALARKPSLLRSRPARAPLVLEPERLHRHGLAPTSQACLAQVAAPCCELAVTPLARIADAAASGMDESTVRLDGSTSRELTKMTDKW